MTSRPKLNRDRALREARLAARLRHHQYVVATYDVRIDDGDVWLVGGGMWNDELILSEPSRYAPWLLTALASRCTMT